MSQYIKIENSLHNLCHECSLFNTDSCTKSKCFVGFAEKVITHAKDNSVQVIEDGEKLIPKDDMKYYREDLIASAIAEVCKLCKECKENHSEKCIISLCRRSLEHAVLKENTTYPGNVLMYLVGVSNQNPSFADLIKSEYAK
ncbi:MAG: hypothetical protein K0R31_905 [Clostridiales bacterium]|jgi:hypothetical protein|nr:hypothetical protein [Clostridiales bacterium]